MTSGRNAFLRLPPDRTGVLPFVRAHGPASGRAPELPGVIRLLLCLISILPAGHTLAAQIPIPDNRPSPLSDLAVRFGARGEFGGDWSIFRPCDASFQLTCRPGLIPQLQPQIQFGLEAAGSIADRLFVDLDYDQTREFAGADRFQLFYQGQEGEFLQRLEVGDVTFALPETRFLTRGIPVGNFGVLVGGEVGGVQLQTVFAQQQGARRTREFRLGGVGTRAGVIYRDTLVLDDADYVQGQFFFLLDPEAIEGAPHLDVLSLRPEDAPLGLAPGSAPIQLYRMERDPVLRQQVEGYIQADATLERDGTVVRESGWFRYLRPGEDYYVHSSGLWVALQSPLRPGDALAVTYIAQNGQRIGDYDPEVVHNRGETPTLRLIRSTQPQHQPDRPTWDLEMKHVYRVSGSRDVDQYSLDLSISLGEESGGRVFRTAPGGAPISFLRLFGLDEQSPGERVDFEAVFQPGDEVLEEAGLQGTFLVFPTLRPFLQPPPVPSAGLSASDASDLLGADVNRRIYDALDPFERSASGLYRLNLTAEIRSSGVTSVFSLGAFGLREGSERIYLGEQILRPFVDYVIDPQAGVVTLLQPEALLARGTSDVLRISWEEPGLFQVAPTSIFGLSAHVPVSDWGAVDLIGLYQLQQEQVNRPRFGAEPPALGMVGIRSTLGTDLPSVDRVLTSLFGSQAGTGSRLSVEGEVALALPDPNRSGDAFLDDFDAGEERTVSLLSNAWLLGSATSFRDGVEDRLPPILDAISATSLVWQHTYIQRNFVGDSLGTFDGFVPQEIDRQINVAGTQTREAGLSVTFGAPRGDTFGKSRWRSLTTLLSPTGTDLTYTEFLDFYVAGGDSLTLIVDLGAVSEDALFIDSSGMTSGSHPTTGDPWGLGLLDQEADPLRGEIWDPMADGRGVWVENCLGEPGQVYDLGHPGANCTRGNGRRETEDLNGNQVLDTAERTVRYVVTLDGSSPYLARDRGATGTGFRLYRIPLRGPLGLAPAGQFTAADWRAVQFMRVTVSGGRASELTLARMRLVGSRWLKRGVEGVLTGVGGDTLAVGGQLEVTPVSVLTEGDAYRAPPSVLEELDDPTSAVSGRGVEFNEKSLALRYRDLGSGDRAEVYNRFLQRPRNFLSYGELRLWVVARDGSWGTETPTDFFVKIGSDPDNFYLYRSRLQPASNPGAVSAQDWLPERVLRFDEWTSLRRQAEQELLAQERPPGAPPVVVWSADSTYAVVLRDRARAPNLAAVREISMGVWNRGQFPVDGEVWINELRLGGGLRTHGTASYLNVAIDGGEFFQARLDYTGQGPRFRQLEEDPTYQADNAVSLSSTFNLGTAVPREWGWDLPLSVAYRWSDRDPFFLEGTDLGTEGLPGLRTTGSRETRVSFSSQSLGSTGNAIVDAGLGGLDARVTVIRSSGTNLTTENRTSGVTGAIGYSWRPEPRTVAVLPGFLESFARILLPGALFQRIQETEFRWSPEEIEFQSGIDRQTLTVDRFANILIDPETGPAGTLAAPESWLDSTARLALRPFQGLGLSLDMSTRRDLLDPAEGVRDPRVRAVVESQRGQLFGQDTGWETRRAVVGRFTFQPSLPRWVRVDFGVQTRYTGQRDPGLVEFGEAMDSIPALLQNSGGQRDMTGSFTLDPSALSDEFLGPSADRDAGFVRALGALGGVISPLTVGVQDGVSSRFYREPINPGTRYQLGLGPGDEFGEIDEVAATTLVDRRGVSSGSGIQLPGTLFLNVNFQRIRARALDRRSDRNSHSRTWPDFRTGVTELPLPASLRRRLPRISMSVGVQEVLQDIKFGSGAAQRRVRVDRRAPIEIAAQWASGLIARYRGLFGRGKGNDPTGVTERDLIEHGFSIEMRLAPDGGLAERIGGPLRLSLILEYSQNTECRVASGQDACVDFIDQINRGASLALDTELSGVEVGAQMSIVDRESFTALRAGFSQFQLGVWGRMVFESGPVEQLQRVPDLF